MKLYATTTSERASKGQGGNKWLYVELKAEGVNGIPTRQDLYSIQMEIIDKELSIKIHDYSTNEIITLIPKEKGKSQKGECNCGSSELPQWHNKKDCKNPY